MVYEKKLKKDKQKEKQDALYIYGRHPVEEMLTLKPKSVVKFFFKENIDLAYRKKIEQRAKTYHIVCSFIDDNRIRRYIGEVNHQGVIAQIGSIEYAELKPWLDTLDLKRNPAVVVMDELTDPHNVGAIIRTASALGVSGIIVGKHNQAPISGTVLKTSAGTALRMPIIRVANINAALDTLKEKGFWIAGLAAGGDTIIWKQDMDMPLAFVVGSEGEGIREKTLQRADFIITIPMENNVESLNASVSTALVLYEWKRSQSN